MILRYIKKSSVIISLLGLLSNLGAQPLVSGQVFNEEGEALPFVTAVLLYPTDSQLVVGTLTAEDGYFELTPIMEGEYILQLSFLGMQTQRQLLDVRFPLALGVFELKDNQQLLETATVAANRQVFVRKLDRLEFRVADSEAASQGDALEVLKITPGVNVQNELIGLIGKSGVVILIDGKRLRLSGQDLSNFLRSIPSENIDKIDVITSPPARYESEGNSGLIDIQLKKALPESWNASIRPAYWQRTDVNGSLGLNYNFNKRGFTLASSLFARDGSYKQEQDDYAYFSDGLWHTHSPFFARISGLSARLDLGYQLTDHWSVGAQYVYNFTSYDVNDTPNTFVSDYTSNSTISRYLLSEGNMKLNPQLSAISLNSELNLDTLGRRLIINLDQFNYDNNDTKNYSGESVINQPSRVQYYTGVNANIQKVENWSATADVIFPSDHSELGFGLKWSQSAAQNEILFFNSGLQDEPVADFVTSGNDFNYKEDVWAVYANYRRQLGDNFELQIGLRTESTITIGQSLNLDLFNENEYVQLFPSVHLSLSANPVENWVFSYNRRTSRPQFFDLNPNIYFVNPFQTIEGNPFLRPSISNNLELSYGRGDWILKSYLSLEDGLFEQVPLANAVTNIIRFTNANYVNSTRWGSTLIANFKPATWWRTAWDLDVNYTLSKFDLENHQPDLGGWNARFSTNNNFYLRDDQKFSMNLRLWYAFPGVRGIFQVGSRSSLSLGVRYRMYNDRLQINLRANDLFRSEAERLQTVVNGVYQEARYYYDSRSLFLSLSYQLGSSSVRAKRFQAGNQSERNRVGG